jgi:hypothetical protein
MGSSAIPSPRKTTAFIVVLLQTWSLTLGVPPPDAKEIVSHWRGIRRNSLSGVVREGGAAAVQHCFSPPANEPLLPAGLEL